MLYITTALSLGLLGGIHCAGMCGPLVFSLFSAGQSPRNTVYQMGLYHFGRILTYGLLGLVIGAFGWGFQLATNQAWLSLFSGFILIVFAGFQLDPAKLIGKSTLFQRWQAFLLRFHNRWWKTTSSSTTFGLGVLNGLLPCGLVYLAILGAANTGSPWKGVVFMAVFGLSTLPILFLVGLYSRKLVGVLGWRLRRSSAYLQGIAGLVLIWRGLNFHLPEGFDFWQAINFAPMCH